VDRLIDVLAMANSSRRPSSAREDYLKAIFRLQEAGTGARRRVHTSDLANELAVSKPSVSAMVKRLAAEDLVDYSPRRGTRLTEKGLVATMRVLRRHRLLETFLVEVLHLDWSEVHAEAEILEHHLSERMVNAIDRVLGHPREDPHGHPIPDGAGRLRERDLVPLERLDPGTHGVVREVRANSAERLQRWKTLGLVPGARVHMDRRQDMEDVMHIDVDAKRVVTGTEGVEGVFVELEVDR
jgi:DtxR family Mn-dependent transcriptional regulator